MDLPPPAPKSSAPLRLPRPEEMPELPLLVPSVELSATPGFSVTLPQPRWWKRPGVWIVPLTLVLAFLIVVVRRMPREGDVFPPADARLPTIVVDAGHGGYDSGALGNGLCEKVLTLDTALRVERLLRARGFAVVLTRNDDTFLPLFDRSQVANALPKAFFVSIHFNDNTSASGDGVETFYAAQKAGWMPVLAGGEPSECSAFAQCVQGSLVTALGVTDRGTHARQLAVVRYARCPAILVEGGFLNNPAEARKLALPEYREIIATGIADGVAAFQQQRERAAHEAQTAHVAQR